MRFYAARMSNHANKCRQKEDVGVEKEDVAVARQLKTERKARKDILFILRKNRPVGPNFTQYGTCTCSDDPAIDTELGWPVIGYNSHNQHNII